MQQPERATAMLIAVGSHNPIKTAAARATLIRLYPRARFLEVDTEPGVSACPRSDEEAIAGAKTRARQARERGRADLGVGLEGGTATIDGAHMTAGWCALFDGERFHLGGGGHIVLPPAVDRMIDGEGAELGTAMDRLSGGSNTKQKNGAIGILTAGLSSRQRAYEDIIAYALASLISAEWYGNPGAAAPPAEEGG
mgnify:CR=1 FL=1